MSNHPADDRQYLRGAAHIALERAFRDRDRQRCSKEDFTAGFVAALRWLGVYEKYSIEIKDARSPG